MYNIKIRVYKYNNLRYALCSCSFIRMSSLSLLYI